MVHILEMKCSTAISEILELKVPTSMWSPFIVRRHMKSSCQSFQQTRLLAI